MFKTGSKPVLNRFRTFFKTNLKIWQLFDQPFWQQCLYFLVKYNFDQQLNISSQVRSPLLIFYFLFSIRPPPGLLPVL